MAKKSVWLIGLDGASFDILTPIIDAGRLPVLGGIIREGARGVLKSTLVPFTPQAWASVITGNNPGRHGVFGFVRQLPGKEPEYLSSKTIGSKKLWTLLGRAGLKSLVVNVPLTYPPEPMSGTMITGMMTPEGGRFTYPAELQERVARDWPDYKLDVSASIDRSRDFSILDELDSALAVRLNLILTLVNETKPDFVFVVFVLPDRIQHAFCQHIHPVSASFQTDKAQEWRERIWDSYTALDTGIGALLTAAGPGADIIFVSDHGFTIEQGGFFTNDFLAAAGMLKLRNSAGQGAARSFIRRLNVPAVKRLVPNKLVKQTINFTKEAIDWAGTAAYASPLAQQGISINLAGREPMGTVSLDRYEQVRSEILAALAAVEVDGRKIVEAFRREEVFSGPYLEAIPDIVLSFEKSGFEAKEMILGGRFVSVSDGGTRGIHHRDGLFAAVGPSVLPGEVDGLLLEDIAPSILGLFGVDKKTGFDGRRREDVLRL